MKAAARPPPAEVDSPEAAGLQRALAPDKRFGFEGAGFEGVKGFNLADQI